MSRRPLWTCPACGRSFANRNQTHACARYTLEEQLAGHAEDVVATYRAFEAAATAPDDVVVASEKTRNAFQVA